MFRDIRDILDAWRSTGPSLPEDPEAYSLISEAQQALSQGDCDAALRIVEEVVGRWPTYPWVWLISAIVRRQAGNSVAARADLAVAIALAPADPTPLRQLAYTLCKEGDSETAGQVMEQAWDLYRRIMRKRVTEQDREDFFADLAA